MDVTIAREFPAMHVLIPAALEFRGDDECCRIEVASGRGGHDHCIGIGTSDIRSGILPWLNAVWGTMIERGERGTAATGVNSIFVCRATAVTGNNRERLASAPHHPMSLKIGPPDFESAA